ncbi:MAG: DUF2892 domain-containing protein [Candidatus Sumerlaeia bacterium]|nr:DUF2892 domain-containing protein [Candidatus Sumerlaeia bacterium]
MKQPSTRFRRWRRRKTSDGNASSADGTAAPKQKRVTRPLVVRVVRILLGVVFLLIGFVGGFIPFLQGWVFVLIGLMLLSRDVPLVRRWFRKLRERFPDQMDALKRWESKAIGQWRKFWHACFPRRRRRNRTQLPNSEKKNE